MLFRSTGLALFSLHQIMSRSDTVDRAVLRVSPDHGKTWETVGEEPVRTPRPEGIQRRVLRGGVADPKTGRLVCFWLSALLPNDDPLEGMRHWTVGYRVSADGGRTWQVDEPVVQSGPEFSRSHPFPGVTTGRNAIMIGDLASVPLVLADGTFLVPVTVTRAFSSAAPPMLLTTRPAIVPVPAGWAGSSAAQRKAVATKRKRGRGRAGDFTGQVDGNVSETERLDPTTKGHESTRRNGGSRRFPTGRDPMPREDEIRAPHRSCLIFVPRRVLRGSPHPPSRAAA